MWKDRLGEVPGKDPSGGRRALLSCQKTNSLGQKQARSAVTVYIFKIFEFKAGLMVCTKSSRSTRLYSETLSGKKKKAHAKRQFNRQAVPLCLGWGMSEHHSICTGVSKARKQSPLVTPSPFYCLHDQALT